MDICTCQRGTSYPCPYHPHSKKIREKDDICRYQELVCKLIWDVLVPRRVESVDVGLGL